MKISLMIKILVLLLLLAALVWAGKWWLIDCRGAGGAIKVKLGRQFQLKLESNATTGFEWQLASPLASSKIKLVDHEYVTPKRGRIGTGGTEIWTFKAVGTGLTGIELKYVRPWEKDRPPDELRKFLIEVKK